MNVRYFVVSLPRTGTTSISKMARVCGLNPKHTPHKYWKNHIENGIFNFFSDTPIYDPNIIEDICKDEKIVSKFIYIDRDFTETFNSWKRMGLLKNYDSFYGNENNFDFVSYDSAFGKIRIDDINFYEVFETHKTKVLDIIKNYNKDYLIYNFNMGWEPFCEFLGCEVPEEEIPKLNTNSFFDKY